jgi:3',5'-cyclic AMP phosphodiesterase CpdA
MGGKRYYTFSPSPDVSFFALDSNYLDRDQIQWLEQQLQASSAAWKIAFFHHPLYSSGAGQKSHLDLRNLLEPLLVKYNVSVVLSGQGGFYERVKPQKGIAYFVVGSGGQLQPGSLDKSSTITAKGFDNDQAFLAVEIVGDEMFYNAISRLGRVVDSGVVRRR